MKRFKFRLEAVEKVRKRSEEEALRVLGEARRRLQEVIEQGENLKNALEASLLRREALGKSLVSASEFAIEDGFIAGTKLRIANLTHAFAKAQRGVEKATRFYLHARRQLHVITTLREREHEAFRKEQLKREQKAIDEMVVMRAAAGRSGHAGEDSA